MNLNSGYSSDSIGCEDALVCWGSRWGVALWLSAFFAWSVYIEGPKRHAGKHGQIGVGRFDGFCRPGNRAASRSLLM